MTPRLDEMFRDVPHHGHPGPCHLGPGACAGDVRVIDVEQVDTERVIVHWQDPQHPSVTGVTVLDGAP